MKRRFASTIVVSALVGASSLLPQAARSEAATDAESAPVPETSDPATSAKAFVPADFELPRLAVAEGFKVVPLGPELVQIDYDAYMSSIEHLQQTFSRSTGWPRHGITSEEAMLDMETEQARFERRESFAYAVLTPDGKRERGCVYVRPSSKFGFDAEVVMWVTKAEFDAGFDDTLFRWVDEWIGEAWPFQRVAYPGRAIDWETWDGLPSFGDVAQYLEKAERFIDAFYSFDRARLEPLLADAPDSAAKILYYQGWAEGGNYRIVRRGPCVATSATVIDCPITVQDDPVLALKTGFNVTDTFSLTFKDSKIAAVDTSSNDQPVYFQAREWVATHMPEVMQGPCKGMEDGSGATPGDCARAMTAGYARFAASKDYPGPGGD